MSGVGEASAIVGLIATAAQLSKAVIDIAGKYKDARKQIESFGHEVAILGNILDQMNRLLGRDHLERDIEVYSVMATVVDQCSEFFSELDVYKDTLYSKQGSVRKLTLRGKAKWVFEAADLEYLRARLESMKTNMLLMMTMQCMHSSDRFESYQATQENARQIQLLALKSDACVKRLEILQEEITIPASNHVNPAIDRMSIMTTDTAVSARLVRESIMSLYGHQSYYQIILDPRKGAFDVAPEMLVDHSRISMIIEDHLHPKNTIHSSRLPHQGERDDDAREPVMAGGEVSSFKFANEVAEAEATESLWNRVFTEGENKRSTPSVGSITSTDPFNVINLAYTPGVTDRPVESIPDTQTTLFNKPLPSLPDEQSSATSDDDRTPGSTYLYRGKAIYSYAADPPDDPNELSFKKHEILAVSGLNKSWWMARNEAGEEGMVPKNYIILL